MADKKEKFDGRTKVKVWATTRGSRYPQANGVDIPDGELHRFYGGSDASSGELQPGGS